MRAVLILFCLFMLAGPARAEVAPAVPVTIKGLQQLKVETYLQLSKQDYLRYGTCLQVANSQLKNMGLDEMETPLGSKARHLKTVNGKKVFNLPKFTQTAPLRESKAYIGEVSANGDNDNKWHLHVKRFAKATPTTPELETEMIFAASQSDRGVMCDLISTTFTLSGKQPLAERQVTTDCLDPFAIVFPDTPATKADSSRYWIKHDCAFGLHYSAEAKRVVLKDMEMHRERE